MRAVFSSDTDGAGRWSSPNVRDVEGDGVPDDANGPRREERCTAAHAISPIAN